MLGQNSAAISHAAQTITVLVYVHADLKRAIKVGVVDGLVEPMTPIFVTLVRFLAVSWQPLEATALAPPTTGCQASSP